MLWYHPACFFETQRRLRSSAPVVTGPDSFRRGCWEALRYADQQTIELYIAGYLPLTAKKEKLR